MTNSGWQQPPVPRQPVVPKCIHLGVFGASFTLHQHAEGHEWICPCGQVFVVVSNGGKDKRLVQRRKR